jgi:hypothetical protein
MTPADAVLVTTAEVRALFVLCLSHSLTATHYQVLLCPFITDHIVVPPKKVNRAACKRVELAMPDGQVPVGCTWDQRDPQAVPHCLARSTPNFEMRLVRECDPIAYDNLVNRVRASMRGEQTDCVWRTLGSGMVGLYCSVVPQTVVLPPPTVPKDHDNQVSE